MADLEGQTPLHNLAFYRSVVRQKGGRSQTAQDLQEYQNQIAAEKRARLQVIDLLIHYKANLNAQTVNGDTPFSIALKENEIDVLHKFVENVKLSESPQLFHHFTSHVLDERYYTLLKLLIKKEPTPLSSEVANVLNKDGFTPFLAYIKHYTEQIDILESTIKNELQYAEWKQKQFFGTHQVSNIQLFDHSTNSSSDQQYQVWRSQNAVQGAVSYFSEFELKDKTEKTLAEIVTRPFIELLSLMVKAEADPCAKVEKLEFYRELDKHKQKLILIEETREGVNIIKDSEMKDAEANKNDKVKSTTVASTTNNVKSRKEVLAERTYEQKVLKNAKKQDSKATDDQKNKRRELHKQLKRFYAEKDFVPRFETINGRKVEQEYVRVFGQQNAMHLLMRRPVKELFNFLVKDMKVPYDEIDYEGLNPIYICIKSRIDRGKDTLSEAAKQLIAMQADFDLADRQGQTPFLHLYNKDYKEAAFYLLDKGADINAMSKAGVFALKMALIRRNNDDIQALVDRGADINQVDTLGRNLLHEAVKMSSATADATFETEQLIINLGVKVNQRDSFGRVPLHYAFVKNSRSTLEGSYVPSTDPIETVSSLCAQKNIEIDVPDKWQKTPLHYASMMGSTISVIYMIQRGASTKSVDIYGNTPLGVAMLYKQFNYAITLIQKNADVKVPVYDEFPNRIDKQWADEEKSRQKELIAATQQNADMEASESEEDNKKHRELFAKKTITSNIFFGYGSDYDDEDDEQGDSSDESEGSVMEKQVYGQNAFGLQNLGIKKTAKKVKKSSWPGQEQAEDNKNKENIEPVTEPKSTFRHAIRNGQQGVAYLILDNGYDYMLAMQDAMDEGKFQLVLTLLSKTSDDRIIQRKNNKGQNLMHILSQNAKLANFQVLERIYKTLKQRGVDCLAADNQQNNALHFAVQSHSTALVKILLAENFNVNAINQAGHSPLSLYFLSCKSSKGLSHLKINLRTVSSSIFNEQMIAMLAKAGSNFNHVYNDYKEAPKVEQKEKASKEESKDEIEVEDESAYSSTILINQIKNCDEFIKREAPDFEMNAGFGGRRVFAMGGMPQPQVPQVPVTFADSELLATLEYLMKQGAMFDIRDSKGRDVMSYAIENNDHSLVKFLLAHKTNHRLLINSQDNAGKSAVHYVVNPIGFGTYENVQILEELRLAGYRFDLKDKDGLTPLDYASEQSSGVLAAKIKEGLGANLSKKKNTLYRQQSFTPAQNWTPCAFNPEEDSQQLLAEVEEKQKKEMMEKDDKPDYIPLDIAVKQEKQYKVYYDEEKRPYDCYLTKVDLANGLYGAYLFYKIQLLHDTNRDLYVVLTRYGRIGEIGMNQRSPFNNAADAIADFSTIFKSKTGNEWTTSHDEFIKMPKKYNLVQVHHTKVKHQDYLAPFDFESCKPGEKLSKKVMNFVEEISNVTMYQRAIQSFNVDTDVLPISGLKRDTLMKAKEILAQIKEILEGKLNQWTDKKDVEEFAKKQQLAETLGELSSKYYELIPLKENEGQPVAPIRNMNIVTRQSELINMLLNVEFSSRILLGALYRQYQVNPIEYIYDCMASKIAVMSTNDPETQLIRAYCQNTAGSDLKNIRIFKIERKGESERFAPFKTQSNRMLLFHGSAMSNYLGILSQGLRIAPPEAPSTGYMFGKGVYFADMFRKSDAYAHGVTSKVLILCEVALGQMKKLYEAKYIEELERPYLSVKGCGRNGPDLRNKLVITPAGFAVPSGLPIKYPDHVVAQPQQLQSNPWAMRQQQMMGGYTLMHNEYIVYNTDQIRMRYLVQVDIK